MIKLALFLASEKGYTCLECLIAAGGAENIGFVVYFREENVIHSCYFVALPAASGHK